MSNYYQPRGFSYLPPVVKNLIIINAIFFLATISLNYTQGIDLTQYLGLHYFASDAFRPYQLVTYMFMHGNFSHLFFNMFAIWMFGNAIENVWGGKRFLIYYILTGFGAAMLHYALVYFDIKPVLDAVQACINNPSEANLQAFIATNSFPSPQMQQTVNSFIQEYNDLSLNNPKAAEASAIEFLLQYRNDYLCIPNIVGASGALFGILLAFGMMFPDSLIYLYFFIPIKAKYFVALYGLIELFAGFQNDPTDNVAHFAHLGGMIFGFLLIRYWKKKGNYPY
jgi:membrane associated rhomboid family serine protease